MLEYKRISRGFWNYALYPVDTDLDKLIEDNGKDKDYYSSIYTYRDEHYKVFVENLKKSCQKLKVKYDENKLLDTVASVYPKLKKLSEKGDKEALELKRGISVAGTENVTTNKLVFDFDSNDDIELSRNDAVEVCHRLIDKGIKQEALQICFSGNKGFSVEIDTDKEFTRKEFEALIEGYAGDLKTFDSKIKDEQRLFRIPLTRHNSSKLYKVPLTLEDLENDDIEEIKANAKNITDGHYKIMSEWEGVDDFKLPIIDQDLEKALDDIIVPLSDLDLSRKPNWLSSAKYALQEGHFVEGERNTAFMILAATYKNQGFDRDMCQAMLEQVATHQAGRQGSEAYPSEQIERNIVGYVYSPNWKGGTYSDKETDLLKTVSERLGLKEEINKDRNLYTVEQSLLRFYEYSKNFSKNRVKLGLKQLDDNLTAMTGMTVGILGSPGAGKTTLANYFMKYTSMNKERVLFESLDMSENFIIARFIQNYVDIDFETIMMELETNEMSQDLLDAIDKVAKDYENVSINYKSGTDVEDIEHDIKKHNEMYGVFPRLVVVDYLEKIRGPYSDSNANTSYVISRLTDLAKEYNTCIIILLQPQKNAGDPRYPLLSMRKVKGASTIEQDCRVILTLWRPGFNPKTMEDDKFMSIAVVKNNMGRLGQYDFYWDGLNGHLRDLDEAEKLELKGLNDRLEEERSSDNEGQYNGY